MLEPIVRTTRFEVSLLPEDDLNYQSYVIGVEACGVGLWAVVHDGRRLGSDGTWSARFVWHRPRCGRITTAEWGDFRQGKAEWEASHRFDRETAVRLAVETAPFVTVNGVTAAEAWRRREAA